MRHRPRSSSPALLSGLCTFLRDLCINVPAELWNTSVRTLSITSSSSCSSSRPRLTVKADSDMEIKDETSAPRSVHTAYGPRNLRTFYGSLRTGS